MPNKATLAALRQLCASCANCRWKGPTELEVVISEPMGFATLRALEDEEVYSVLADAQQQLAFDQGRDGSVAAGASIVLRVPRQVQRLIVVEGLADLLTVPGTQCEEPHAYILVASRAAAEPFLHLRGDPLEAMPEDLRRYHDAIRLWTLLLAQAEHVDSSSGALLFFGIRRTEICPGFDIADLPEVSAVSEIQAFIENPDRKATRGEIFSAALSEFLRDQNKDGAFRALLRDTPRFARRLREGLAIYLAENSPEKLAAEAKGTALSISEKLEKIIGGIETKSLSIPAALLLAVKDVEPGIGLTSINVIILASALTYGVTMTLVHRSQSGLLEIIRETIRSTVAEFEKKGLDRTNPVIAKTYAGMTRRCEAALTGSRAMLIGSWIPLVCVLGTMFLRPPKAASAGRAAYDTAAPAVAPVSRAALLERALTAHNELRAGPLGKASSVSVNSGLRP